MAAGTGYSSETKGSVAPLTQGQRQRLEASTFSIKLLSAANIRPDVTDIIRLADFIATGER